MSFLILLTICAWPICWPTSLVFHLSGQSWKIRYMFLYCRCTHSKSIFWGSTFQFTCCVENILSTYRKEHSQLCREGSFLFYLYSNVHHLLFCFVALSFMKHRTWILDACCTCYTWLLLHWVDYDYWSPLAVTPVLRTGPNATVHSSNP